MTLSPARLGLAVAAVVLASSPAAAGVIVGYDPADPASRAVYDRFTGGFPAAPTPNTGPAFVGAGLDLTGVGFRVNGGWGATLVTPLHIVTAAHVGLFAPGEEVRFVAADGSLRSAAVATDPATGAVRQTLLATTFRDPDTGVVRTLPSDLLVVTLAEAVSAGVTPLAVAGGLAPAGTPLLVDARNADYGSATRQLGTNTLDELGVASFTDYATEATVVAVYDFTRSVPGDTALISGDSSGALLTTAGGRPVFLGTHYGVDGNLADPTMPYLSASAYLPAYLSQLAAVVVRDGQSLAVVGLSTPAPATAGVAALAAGLSAAGRRRRVGTMPA